MADGIENASNAIANLIPLALTVGIVGGMMRHSDDDYYYHRKKKKKYYSEKDNWLS